MKTKHQAHGDWEEGVAKLPWSDRGAANPALASLNLGTMQICAVWMASRIYRNPAQSWFTLTPPSLSPWLPFSEHNSKRVLCWPLILCALTFPGGRQQRRQQEPIHTLLSYPTQPLSWPF